jgi:hypothetical protein
MISGLLEMFGPEVRIQCSCDHLNPLSFRNIVLFISTPGFRGSNG